MPKVNAPLYSLNGGEVGPEGLARLDLERMRFAGSLYSNVLPRVIGSMTFRPGLEFLKVLSFEDARLLENNNVGGTDFLPIVSDDEVRIFQDGDFLERSAVGTTIQNGAFASFTGWTDESTGSATATVSGGQLVLTGGQFSRSEARQTITVASGDQNLVHGLRVKVARGPVSVAIGTTAALDDVRSMLTLDDGDHSLAFTPGAGTVYLRVWSDVERIVLVDSCDIDASGDIVLDSPYQPINLVELRYRQSRDKTYIASDTYQQREIVRWGDDSWGLQRYRVSDGPFEFYTGDISLRPSVFTGNGTLTSSLPYFESTMIGRLFRLTQTGQTVRTDFDAEDQQGSYIRVSGVGDARKVNYTVSGVFVATWSLQVATDDGSGTPTGWTDVKTRTGAETGSYTDEGDNVIKFFRFQVATGNYTSGTVETALEYVGGSQDGICRVIGYTSPTVMDMEVLERFYSTDATRTWDYSVWSDFDGWPGAVELFGGRLFWERSETMFGSVSDAFNSYDDTVEGDSAPVIRSLNSGGQRGARWLLALQRLMVGTDVSEVSVRSSAFDEPLTAANWHPLDASTHGSHDVRALKVDKDGIYVASDGVSLHRLSFDGSEQDYASTDLTELHQEIFGGSKVKALAVQRKPDTVVWIALEDGSVRALTYEPRENVVAWSRIVTYGKVEDIAVNKGTSQDLVYMIVLRDGVRQLERLASLKDCRSADENCLADSFVRFDGGSQLPAVTYDTVNVQHLDGKKVTVWADGEFRHDQGNLYTVSGGEVILSPPATKVVIGLPYTGAYQSTKLAYGAGLGTALFQPKRVSGLGLYFVNSVMDGVRVGRDAINLFQFTVNKNDAALVAGAFQEEFDGPLEAFSGDWDTDSRVYIEMRSPYPCTVAALAMQVKTNDIG